MRRRKIMGSDRKRLLVVVDMQKDFTDGSLGTAEAQAIVPAVVKKIQKRMEEGWEAVFTQDTHFDNYLETLEGRNLPVVHCVKGTPGWELVPELSGFPGKRFEKSTFGSTELAVYARNGDYEEVEIVGVCTDICVLANSILIRTVLPGAQVSVDSACCAGVSPESHRNALDAMKMCQITVV